MHRYIYQAYIPWYIKYTLIFNIECLIEFSKSLKSLKKYQSF